MLKYFYNLFIGIDQLLNVVTGGYPDETLSARAYRTKNLGHTPLLWLHLINLLLWFDKEKRKDRTVRHCELSYESELLRRQYPKHYQVYK